MLLAQTRDARTGVWQIPRPVATGGLYPRWALGGDRAALAFTCPTQGGSKVVVTDWDVVPMEESWPASRATAPRHRTPATLLIIATGVVY